MDIALYYVCAHVFLYLSTSIIDDLLYFITQWLICSNNIPCSAVDFTSEGTDCPEGGRWEYTMASALGCGCVNAEDKQVQTCRSQRVARRVSPNPHDLPSTSAKRIMDLARRLKNGQHGH